MRMHVPLDSLERWKEYLGNSAQWDCSKELRHMAQLWWQDEELPSYVLTMAAVQPRLQGLRKLFAFPEYRLPLPKGGIPSRSDLYVLASNEHRELVVMMLEATACNAMGPSVQEWLRLKGKTAAVEREDVQKAEDDSRTQFLSAQLGLLGQSIVHVKYQFLYRTALALLEAERVGARQAAVWFHCSEEVSFQEYRKFVALYGVEGEADALCGPVEVRGVSLFFAWVFLHNCQD
nr:hypothetical protein [uncultured Anaeromusa sp.]